MMLRWNGWMDDWLGASWCAESGQSLHTMAMLSLLRTALCCLRHAIGRQGPRICSSVLSDDTIRPTRACRSEGLTLATFLHRTGAIVCTQHRLMLRLSVCLWRSAFGCGLSLLTQAAAVPVREVRQYVQRSTHLYFGLGRS